MNEWEESHAYINNYRSDLCASTEQKLIVKITFTA